MKMSSCCVVGCQNKKESRLQIEIANKLPLTEGDHYKCSNVSTLHSVVDNILNKTVGWLIT